MPIYEYVCQSCGEKFEQFRSISDDDGQIKCPKCSEQNVKRLFSLFATGSSGDGCASSSHT